MGKRNLGGGAKEVNKVHRKPESCGAKRVTVNGVNNNNEKEDVEKI